MMMSGRAGFSQGDLHEINEQRMMAKWVLGGMLKAAARTTVAGPGRGKVGDKTKSQSGKSFSELLKRLKLDKNRAVEMQRINSIPKIELRKIFAEARKAGEMVTVSWLVDAGRPYWYKANRQKRHRDIAKVMEAAKADPDKYGDLVAMMDAGNVNAAFRAMNR